MKKNYLTPSIKVYSVKCANVIATSGSDSPVGLSETESLTERDFTWE